MISTVLADNPWVTTVALVVVVVGAPLAAGWSARRPGWAWVFTAVSLVVVAGLTFTPTATPGTAGCTVQWSAPALGRVELAANFLLLVPSAVLATAASRRPRAVLVGGAVLPALIELVQAVVPALGRACDADDWLYNALGAAAGVLLAQLGLGLLGRVRRRPGRAAPRAGAGAPR